WRRVLRARADPLGGGAGTRPRAGHGLAGPTDASPPELLDAAVLFAPSGDLVPVAMRALDQGGTLAVARTGAAVLAAP
ncbi:MAG: alcohol dehydrogenase, propanol-preferring, partial [Pseudonocardiales bacterium]|nr:alcohol dehydrogenase, propanol-preferring [Pseudonocardiales bacterium]